MPSQELLSLISSLSRDQQAAVEEFVRMLKAKPGTELTFRAALDEFVRTHPELLRKLAQ